VSRYQKGKTDLDFTEARDSEWQWHQFGHMQVCTSLQTDNHTSTPHSVFLQAGWPSCRPTNSVKALKAISLEWHQKRNLVIVVQQRNGNGMWLPLTLNSGYNNVVCYDAASRCVGCLQSIFRPQRPEQFRQRAQSLACSSLPCSGAALV